MCRTYPMPIEVRIVVYCPLLTKVTTFFAIPIAVLIRKLKHQYKTPRGGIRKVLFDIVDLPKSVYLEINHVKNHFFAILLNYFWLNEIFFVPLPPKIKFRLYENYR